MKPKFHVTNLRKFFDLMIRCGGSGYSVIDVIFIFAFQESGKQLTSLYGPGYTGLLNLGNRQVSLKFYWMVTSFCRDFVR